MTEARYGLKIEGDVRYRWRHLADGGRLREGIGGGLSVSTSWMVCAVTLLCAGCACDGRPSCAFADRIVLERCGGRDTGGWGCEAAVASACNVCVEAHFERGGDCATLGEACVDACCFSRFTCSVPPPPPQIDAALPVDAGEDEWDAGPPVCGAVGQLGGQCRVGTTCATGVTCFEEVSHLMDEPLTLGILGIPAGEPDPANEGEHLSTGVGSTVPIRFAPGGQCSRACNPAAFDDGCGYCATCSRTLGGTAAWGEGGITVRSFDPTMMVSEPNPGICRLDCQYDPATSGGCPEGYTCDAGQNVCLEACVDDRQCNLGWGVSRTDGPVAYELEGAPYICSDLTGRCEWEAPSSAGLNTECERSADCPHPGGICLLGRCGTLACADATGTMAGPVACEGECLGFGGNNGSVCLQGCNAPEDCFAGQACSQLGSTLPSGHTGICHAICDGDAECRTAERCHTIGVESAPGAGDALSVCEAICDPDPADGVAVPGAVSCRVEERCVRDGANDFGYCARLDQLCGGDEECNGPQACEVLGDDLFGRCVDGCRDDLDCTGGERCRRQPDGEGGLRPFGVCRAEGEPCAPSPTDGAGALLQPLRGDAQCPPGQMCSSVDPEVVGACADG